MPVQALGQTQGVARQVPAGIQLVLPQGPEEGGVPGLIDVGPQRTAQVPDPPVPQRLEPGDSHGHPLVVVNAGLGHGPVALDVVVVEHRRGGAGAKLPHLRVQQGQPQEKSPLIALLEHIRVIAHLLLERPGQRDDVRLVVRRAAERLGYRALGHAQALRDVVHCGHVQFLLPLRAVCFEDIITEFSRKCNQERGDSPQL